MRPRLPHYGSVMAPAPPPPAPAPSPTPPPPPPPAPSPFTLNIAASVYAPNIRSLAVAGGWDGVGRLTVNITAPLVGVFKTGATKFPNGCQVNIAAGSRVAGPPGGTAFEAETFVDVYNLGAISGGGGRGGTGTSVPDFRVVNTGNSGSAQGGSGGAGQGVIASGSSAVIQSSTSGGGGTRVNVVDSTSGVSGWAQGGAGGAGGSWGESGAAGNTYSKSSSATVIRSFSPVIDRSAGAAVVGNSMVSWLVLGTIQGERRG